MNNKIHTKYLLYSGEDIAAELLGRRKSPINSLNIKNKARYDNKHFKKNNIINNW